MPAVGRFGDKRAKRPGLNSMNWAYYWECVCPGPFCIGGTECFWIEFWHGLILPGHWVSIDVSGGDRYIKWSLDGAGPNTPGESRGPLLMGNAALPNADR